MQKKTQAFTVVELVVVVVILGIIASIAAPEILSVKRNAKALETGACLQAIEAAKNQWRREYPGATIPSEAALAKYFPGNNFPQDPWNANGFRNTTSLTTKASHIYNNIPEYEPSGNCSPTNGYNDAYQKR